VFSSDTLDLKYAH